MFQHFFLVSAINSTKTKNLKTFQAFCYTCPRHHVLSLRILNSICKTVPKLIINLLESGTTASYSSPL